MVVAEPVINSRAVSPVGGDFASSLAGEFAAFYRANCSQLTAYVMYLGADYQLAADIVQDTMLTLFREWYKIRAPRAYARRSAQRAYWETKRRAARLTWTEDLNDELDTATEASIDGHLEAVSVLDAINRLPPRQRTVFALIVDGYQPNEIAVLLRMYPSTIRSHLRHARETLKRDLGL